MSTLVRTEHVPAADLVDFIRGVLVTMWVPMDVVPGQCADYRAVLRASGMGPMQVVTMDVPPAVVSRTPKLISQADPDMLKLVLVRGGNTCVVDQDGRQASLSAGEFALYDTRRPFEVVCGADRDEPVQMMTFMFPSSLLPLSRNRLGRLTAVPFRPGAGLGEVTSQFLLQLARNIDHYSPAEAARLSGAALEILATRLVRDLDLDDWDTPEARRHAQLTTVQDFIRRHLGDTGLSPAMIAAAHHMSLRSLQQLFHDEGLTVAGWIRKQRLDCCRNDLSDPALASRPVAAIAARWGFSSPGDFSRTFRAVHGMPPAEYRMLARTVKGPALLANDIPLPVPDPGSYGGPAAGKHGGTAMSTTDMTSRTGDYSLGHTPEEYERLRAQARVWEAATGRVLDQVGVPEGAGCLDAGCGPGETMRLLAERVGTGGRVVGMDADASIGRLAVEMLHGAGHRQCAFHAHDLTADAPVPGAPFDVVYARLLLFHLPQRVAVLKRLWDAVAPGGHLVVQDYDLRTLGVLPELDSFGELRRVMFSALEVAGVDVQVGARLASLFEQAGAGAPDGTDVVGRIEPLSAGRVMTESVYRSLLPVALAHGITTEKGVAAALAAFDRDVTRFPGSPMLWPLMIAAWKRKEPA